ncbi:MAG: hypothetical protein K2L45_05215 [Muribaculaceae bacterium]|nr:hypothetical protein [Muribaculaceae bacterium]
MIECPFCGMDNAYCDGVEYVCPDCGRCWPCDEIPHDNWNSDDDDDDDDFDCKVTIKGRRH